MITSDNTFKVGAPFGCNMTSPKDNPYETSASAAFKPPPAQRRDIVAPKHLPPDFLPVPVSEQPVPVVMEQTVAPSDVPPPPANLAAPSEMHPENHNFAGHGDSLIIHQQPRMHRQGSLQMPVGESPAAATRTASDLPPAGIVPHDPRTVTGYAERRHPAQSGDHTINTSEVAGVVPDDLRTVTGHNERRHPAHQHDHTQSLMSEIAPKRSTSPVSPRMMQMQRGIHAVRPTIGHSDYTPNGVITHSRPAGMGHSVTQHHLSSHATGAGFIS